MTTKQTCFFQSNSKLTVAHKPDTKFIQFVQAQNSYSFSEIIGPTNYLFAKKQSMKEKDQINLNDSFT